MVPELSSVHIARPALVLVFAVLALVSAPQGVLGQAEDSIVTAASQREQPLSDLLGKPGARDSLRAVGFEPYGEFYHIGWVDPITRFGTDVVFSDAESPEELAVPPIGHVPGGRLVIWCLPVYDVGHEFNMAVGGGFTLSTDPGATVRGIARVGDEVLGPSGEWDVGGNGMLAFVPEEMEEDLWSSLMEDGDTLSVRITDARGSRATYVFALDGLTTVAEEFPTCP